jgi:hypothetical protein
VIQCWAEDPDGRLYLYREIYKTRTLVEDHAKRILREVTKCVTCCKPRKGGRPRLLGLRGLRQGVDRAEAARGDLRPRRGGPGDPGEAPRMSTVAADKRVKVGIEAVQTRTGRR